MLIDVDGRSEQATIVVRVDPISSVYDANHIGWRKQASTLSTSLSAANIGAVRKVGGSADGSKGTLDEVIIALGSAGAITAAVEIFRSWLSRDRSREIKLTIESEGKKTTIALNASSTGDSTVESIMLAALERNRGDG